MNPNTPPAQGQAVVHAVCDLWPGVMALYIRRRTRSSAEENGAELDTLSAWGVCGHAAVATAYLTQSAEYDAVPPGATMMDVVIADIHGRLGATGWPDALMRVRTRHEEERAARLRGVLENATATPHACRSTIKM